MTTAALWRKSMSTATIGTRYQVVIPKREREQLGLRPHAKVVVEISDGAVVIRPLPDGDWRGVGRDLADGTDATDYVKKLRAEWESGG